MKNLKRVLGSIAFLFVAGSASAAEQIVVNSFGGEFQAAQKKAFFEPFQKATSIVVKEDSGASVGTIKATVLAGDPRWDLIMIASGDYPTLVKEGLIETIDYDKMDPGVVAELLPDARKPSAVVGHFYACGIAYRTDLKTKGHPTSWAEFWDTKRFPGPRALPKADYWVPAWEAALLADGVKREELYPLDFKRALKSLDKIKDSVQVWYSDTAAGVQALVSGEADYAFLCHNRVVAARNQGAPVDVEHNEAILLSDMWVVPKGAKNKDNIWKFLSFYMTGAPQIELMKMQPVAPSNGKAYAMIAPDIAKDLATSPQNVVKMVPSNAEFWGTEAPGGSQRDYSIKLFEDWFGR
ncbi:ABC transporter substrate-binding protein [Chelatococcus sp. GCM10030263]|uniref:ABC transporter substrate-binding protein n=1 Tax=Chelatococcus sp. GCM10030263 TaxID=3273387 RepID=UPI0036164D6C